MRNSKLGHLVNFIRRYYSQFDETLKSEQRDLESQAREKIQTLVDVSKWSVQKFTIIKSNIDRTHRQLYSTIKNYRANVVMNTPITSVLQKSKLQDVRSRNIVSEL